VNAPVAKRGRGARADEGRWDLELAQPLELVQSWGRALRSQGRVVFVTQRETLVRAFEEASRQGRTIAMRGSGCSYSDTFQNEGGVVVDTSGMNRILEFDSKTGLLKAEPGLTIAQIWRTTLPLGWWPPVVTGTMFASMGGLAAVNAHGKNNFKRGTFGEHIVEFTMLLPTGEEVTCSPKVNADLYYSAIGGLGLLGAFTSITLQLKRVYSGLLEVEPLVLPDFETTFRAFDERRSSMDYLVGWVDCFGSGSSMGRGIIHAARYLHEGEDAHPEASLQPVNQELPSYILGVIPKGWTWMALRPFVNDTGMRLINMAKYLASRIHADGYTYRQPLAAFSFLLDYVPNWKLAYGPGGLIQYQSFIPKEHARRVFETLIEMSQSAGLPPYLGVLKRHRPDPFLLTHAVDGYSLALDYKVTESNRAALWKLAEQMDPVVFGVGGRFYFSKDATCRPGAHRDVWPAANVEQFLALKHRCDPKGLLQTKLFQRVFGEDARTLATV